MHLARGAAVLVLTPLIMMSGCGTDTPQEGPGDRRPVSQIRLRDGVGDAGLVGPNGTYEVAKTIRNVDIVAAVVRRTSRYLHVRVIYRDLAPRASAKWNVSFNVATSKGHGYTSNVVWERGQWGDSGMVDGTYVHAEDWYQGVDVSKGNPEDDVKPQCPHAAAAKVDYPKATLTIRVANRCLDGDPAWMRVDGLSTSSRAPHGSNDYHDNPFNATAESESTPRLVAPAR